MTTIIATIKPQHLGNIRSGKKVYEIRKTAPKAELPIRVLCCESGSGGQIKCEFTIDHIVEDSLDALYKRSPSILPFHNLIGTCLTVGELQNYVNRSLTQPYYMWHITNMIDYCSAKGCRVRNISEFGLTRPPQSWQYMEEG